MATVLIGGSALLIAAGGISLAFGFGGADEGLLWTAIASAAAAAILLVAAYLVSLRQLRTARRAEAAAEGGFGVAAPAPAPGGVTETSEPEETAPDDGTDTEEPAETEEEAAETPPVSAEDGDADEGAAAGGAELVAVKKRFHKPDCRYAQSSNASRISRAEAEEQGLTACGVCKP